MLTDKQKQEREASLGSSDAPVVCGVSSYSSPLELFYKLTGQIERYSDEETEAQEWGSTLEEPIRAVVQNRTGLRTRRIGGRVHGVHAGLIAHADYEIIGERRGPGILEIKCRDRSDAPRWREGIPDDIHLQVAHQLSVMDRDWAKVAVLFGGNKLEIFDVERDLGIEEYLIKIELQFLARVQRNEPPGHDWTPETVGILKKLYPTDSGKSIILPLDNRTDVALDNYYDGKREMERGEALKAEGEGWLKAQMQDATTAEHPRFKISWKSTKASQKFDTDRFEKEQPGLYAQYLKTVPGYRRFSVEPSTSVSK